MAASLTHPTSPPTDADSRFAATVEAAKLQALYNLAYGLSHEINNPLANIATRAQTLLIDEKDPERRKKLATINQQAFRAHEMIADLMLFARPPALRLESVDVASLADTIVAELQDQAQEQDTSLVRAGSEEPVIASLDPTQIAVALRALVVNSLEAVRTGGQVILDFGFSILDSECGSQRPSSDPEYLVPGTQYSRHPHPSVPTPHFPSHTLASNPKSKIQNLKLSVSDTGPGIPPSVRPHIFDPFYSGREAGRGLGLGLSKAWRIVTLHGGTLAVDSPAGGGAVFTIALPQS
jgi:signal transduction histidine kinase